MSSAPQVLRDPDHDRHLAEHGFVIIELLDPDEVAALSTSYAALAPDDDEGLTIDFVRADRRMLRVVAGLMAPVWERHLDTVFVDHRPVVATFVVKHPGPGSEMVLHNEPTFVDPAVAVTHNVWIPLVDVQADPPNGALELVPGSHRLSYGLGGFNTPLLFRPYEQFLRDHTITLEVPAGSAVIYDSHLLHVSGPNLTSQVRPAIAAALAPRSAPLVHVVACGRRRRRLYGVDEDFFLDVHPAMVGEVVGAGLPVVREVQDDGRITPVDVAAALGVDTVPIPQVLVPEDLGRGHTAGALERRSSTKGRFPLDDVALGATALAGEHEPSAGLRVTGEVGSCATLPVPRRGERRGRWALVPTGVWSLLDRWRPGLVAVLDPDARLTLTHEDGASYLVRVYECPMVNAGIATPTGAATFEIGDEIIVDGPGPVSLWNDGPGPVWVVFVRRRRRRA